MTADELRSLADEATPGPWQAGPRTHPPAARLNLWEIEQGPQFVTPEMGLLEADARLIALAPDLARLCADLWAGIEACRGHSHSEPCPVCAALAKLSELKL